MLGFTLVNQTSTHPTCSLNIYFHQPQTQTSHQWISYTLLPLSHSSLSLLSPCFPLFFPRASSILVNLLPPCSISLLSHSPSVSMLSVPLIPVLYSFHFCAYHGLPVVLNHFVMAVKKAMLLHMTILPSPAARRSWCNRVDGSPSSSQRSSQLEVPSTTRCQRTHHFFLS
jgi:hypothetical protein